MADDQQGMVAPLAVVGVIQAVLAFSVGRDDGAIGMDLRPGRLNPDFRGREISQPSYGCHDMAGLALSGKRHRRARDTASGVDYFGSSAEFVGPFWLWQAPRLCNKAIFAPFAVRKPYAFLVTSFTLLFSPSTAPTTSCPWPGTS